MKTILCFGDSNTWGYDYTTYNSETDMAGRLSYDERWPGIVQSELGEEYHIIEEAMNGRTCMCDDPFFPYVKGIDALKMALNSHAPLDLVIIHLGVNDLKHMFQLTAGMIAYGVGRLVEEAQNSYYGYPSPKVLLIAPPPVRSDIEECIYGFSFGKQAYEKSCAFGKEYRKIANRLNCDFLDCGSMNFRLNTLDGLHYSKEDHFKLAQAVCRIIPDILK